MSEEEWQTLHNSLTTKQQLIFIVSFPIYIILMCVCVRACVHAGLPASTIAISEGRLYWSGGSDNPGIFYVDRSTISTAPVGVLSETAESAVIVTTDPGQQLIAGKSSMSGAPSSGALTDCLCSHECS